MSQSPRTEARPSLFERVWRRFLGSESWVRRRGDFREKERFSLLQRPQYAYGMLRAADIASYTGKSAVTVCEFGVAEGHGLLNMVALAALIREETGVELNVVGFDTGEGLPEVSGHKDHAELWSPGDFTMISKDTLLERIDGRARVVFGDIRDTVDDFTRSLTPESPLGFVAMDVDIYSGCKSALRCLLGPPDSYNPSISMYFDDVAFFFANTWCGELAAIEEHNAENQLRKIDHDRSLPGRRARPFETWHRCMYVGHALDHDIRNNPRARDKLTIGDHHSFMTSGHLY